MSHFACAEEPTIRSTRSQIAALREMRALFRGIAGLARQLVRHLSRAPTRITTWCARASRSTARNPTPGKPNPMRPVVELEGAHRAGARGRRRARPSATAPTWTAKRPTPHSRSSRSAMRTAILRAASAIATQRPGARRSSPAALPLRRPRLDGPDRGRRDRRAGSRDRGAATWSTLIGAEHQRRRGRGPRRHHRLRGADQPRPALSADLPVELCS